MADAHRVAEYLKRNAIGRIVSLRGPFFSHEKVVLIRVDGAMATVKGALSNFKQNLEDVTTVVIY